MTPIDFAEANAFVARFHRHHKPMPGCKFSVAVSDESGVRGVAMVGRPVARMTDDGWTLEVNRVCTDGARNACSMLYGAAWRAAKALGYRKLITYTLPAEGGASLRAAGWTLIGERGGGQWGRASRPRIDVAETIAGQKLLWEAPSSPRSPSGAPDMNDTVSLPRLTEGALNALERSLRNSAAILEANWQRAYRDDLTAVLSSLDYEIEDCNGFPCVEFRSAEDMVDAIVEITAKLMMNEPRKWRRIQSVMRVDGLTLYWGLQRWVEELPYEARG